jgi:hypothetical protein
MSAMLQAVVDFLTNSKLGNASSILGLVLSLIGFAITIKNVRRSRAASEEAKEAVIRVQAALSRVDAVADIASAVSTMEEIKRLQRELAWPVLPDRYAALRKHLTTIKASFRDLNEQQKVVIQNAIQHFAGIEDLLERTAADQLTRKDVARLNKIMSSQIDALHELLTTIRVTIEV